MLVSDLHIKGLQLEQHFRAIKKRINCEKCDYISFGDRYLVKHTKIDHEMVVKIVKKKLVEDFKNKLRELCTALMNRFR